MRAVVYNGPRDVSISKVADPKIERPTDAIVKMTTTNICGSDLHMYEGRTSFEKGNVIGHENLGQVVEVGVGVDEAPAAYGHFDARNDGWTKMVLKPAA